MKNRAGVSMIEILVSMSVFGVSAVGLAKLAMTGSQRGIAAAGTTQQTSMLLSEFTRATAVPAAGLPEGITCDTVPLSAYRFERCTRVTNVTTRSQRVSVVVRPAGTPITAEVNGVVSVTGATTPVAPFRAESLFVVRASNVGALDLAGTP